MNASADVIVQIEAPEADEDELADLSRRLLAEIRESPGVERADLMTDTDTPSGGRKGGGIEELGSLAVTVLPVALPSLVGMLRSWIARPRSQPVKISLKVGSRSMQAEFPVGAMSQENLDRLMAFVGGAPPAADPDSAKPN